MLNKYKEVRPKKGVNKLFKKCFHVWGVFRNFFREGAFKFDIFLLRNRRNIEAFFGKTIARA